MFFLLSLRVSAAEKRLENHSLGKQLQDNVQVALELIELSLKEMDRKNATFYQLTERAERLRQSLASVEKRGRKKKGLPAPAPQAPEEPSPLPAAYERLLAAEESVRLDLSSRPPVATATEGRSASRSPFLGLLEGTGQFVMKLFGVNKDWQPPRQQPAVSVKPAADFADLLAARQKGTGLDILSDDEFELPFHSPGSASDVEQLTPAGRRALAQDMLASGSPTMRIVQVTGLSRAEVEFLQALPVRPNRPRRTRRQADDG